ncbi:MAG: glycosyltransferase [Alistipes sp.]|nr:glycosyltransferase [Alistipes sp.]
MNKTSQYRFTIVVPVYNETENVARLEETFRSYLAAASCPACVLFVNDGSTDDSLARLAEVCARNEHFYYLSFARNAGLSAAIKAGIDYAQSPLVGYIDADLQTTPEDFELLLPHAGEHALVTGIRANRKDTFFKRFQSRFANGFRRMMTRDGATDTGCPLKVMQTPAARRIPFFRGMHRFLPALILLQEGARYREIPVRHFPRTAGESKFHLWNRLVSPLMDCFAYRWMKKRAINYTVDSNNL